VKVAIDENLPPALARALDALFAGEHQVVHIRSRFGPSVKDVEWIRTLSNEGNWVVLSNDRRITRSKAELREFKDSRLVGFFFARALEKAKLI
jgi:predicted nuclease of predicted toxin-antitoxin system